MKKRMVSQSDLEDFSQKLEKLKNITDISILKSQLEKAISYFNNNILNKDLYLKNELTHIIFVLSQSKNKYVNSEEYLKLYKDIKIHKLSIDEIIKRYDFIVKKGVQDK